MAKESDLNKVVNDTLISSFEPTDYSDVGQGQLLAEAYKHRLAYCDGMGWFTYKDGIWVQSDIDAHGYSQKLTDLQYQEALANQMSKITQRSTGASCDDPYLNYARLRRSSARIAATLKEATPKLSIETSMLDGDPLILNTPCGEIHLDTSEMTPHNPNHYITHMTKLSPSGECSEIWTGFFGTNLMW